MNIVLAYFDPFVGLSGGTEQVLCRFANAMTERGHHVSIVYCYGHDGRPYFPLSEAVPLYNLMDYTPWRDQGKGLSHCLSLPTRLMREVIRLGNRNAAIAWTMRRIAAITAGPIQQILGETKPDVILSSAPKTTYLLMTGPRVTAPIISMFHFTPDHMLAMLTPEKEAAMARCACMQVLLPSDIPAIRAAFPQVPAVCIPNVVPRWDRQADLAAPRDRHTILHVGRLDEKQKRQHLLIEAFADLAEDFPDWDVEFWGAEQESHVYTDRLHRRIEALGLTGRIRLMGETDRIEDVYPRGDLFCFPSPSEGFGLALGEAMSAGLPAIGFRSCQAVSALITDGETGLLADDGVAGLAAALRRLMADRDLRIAMGQKARAAMAAYAPDRIWDRWEALLRAVTEGKNLP